MKQLCEVSIFLSRLRMQLKFGHLSRAPLRLLRFEVCGSTAECEWVARPPDRWDADLPRSVSEHNASLQALEDAIAVRELLFFSVPGVDSAEFRVYRHPAGEVPELVIAGTVNRDDELARSVRSVAMRAKLCGLRFWLNDGVLGALQPEQSTTSP
jgi:hypothetical protein